MAEIYSRAATLETWKRCAMKIIQNSHAGETGDYLEIQISKIY
jgi:hypothetical protein